MVLSRFVPCIRGRKSIFKTLDLVLATLLTLVQVSFIVFQMLGWSNWPLMLVVFYALGATNPLAPAPPPWYFAAPPSHLCLLRCTSTFIQEAGPADLRIIAGSSGLHRPFTLQSPRHYDGAIQQDARCLLHGRTSKCLSVSLLLTSQVRHASVCLDATHMPAYCDCHAEEGCDRVVAVKAIYMHSRYACSAFPPTCVSATCVSATWPICPALQCLLRHAWCTVARPHPCGFAAARAAHPSGGSPFM